MVSTPSDRQTVSSSGANETPSTSLGNVLSSCLDMLRIEDVGIRRKAVEFAGSIPVATVNAYGKWIAAVKAVADSCAVNSRIFSQSEMCDFLAVAAKGLDAKRSGSKAVNDATFKIYVDIMENYPTADSNLRMHLPRIIVDTISALEKGVDTRGEAVGIYAIDRYYQERKQSAPGEDPSVSYSPVPVGDIKARSTSAIRTAPAYTEELVQSLMHITGRSRRDLERSLANLHPIDIAKIKDLSANYKRLQKYSKLSSPNRLKKEVEKEIGRRLTENQLQHAINSIRKARSYIENVLDGKFVPHGTHGINHVKHNLEYGYQLMGLMAPRKRRTS